MLWTHAQIVYKPQQHTHVKCYFDILHMTNNQQSSSPPHVCKNSETALIIDETIIRKIFVRCTSTIFNGQAFLSLPSANTIFNGLASVLFCHYLYLPTLAIVFPFCMRQPYFQWASICIIVLSFLYVSTLFSIG